MTQAETLARNAHVSPAVAYVVVCASMRFGIRLKELRGPSRLPHLVAARRWVVLQARNLSTSGPDGRHNGYPSYWEIGRALNRDHSTIRHAEKVARQSPCVEAAE